MFVCYRITSQKPRCVTCVVPLRALFVAIEPVLRKQIFKRGGQWLMRLG